MLNFLLRKLLQSVMLILGVTFISFILMVYFGPDQTYNLLGKSPSPEQIQEIRHELGYDRPFLSRYAEYVADLFTLQLGHSSSNGEAVKDIISRTLPVTLALVIPGFILGNVLGVLFGLIAAWNRNRWLDRVISALSVAGMSLSFLIIRQTLNSVKSTAPGVLFIPIPTAELKTQVL